MTWGLLSRTLSLLYTTIEEDFETLTRSSRLEEDGGIARRGLSGLHTKDSRERAISTYFLSEGTVKLLIRTEGLGHLQAERAIRLRTDDAAPENIDTTRSGLTIRSVGHDG